MFCFRILCLFVSVVVPLFISVSVEAHLFSVEIPRGSLGPVNAQGRVQGWTFDEDHPGESLMVHYYVVRPNGLRELAGAVLADIPRADINEALGSSGNHGVAFDIPHKYRTGQPHTLYMYAIDPDPDPDVINPLLGSRTFSLVDGTGSVTDTGDSSDSGSSGNGNANTEGTSDENLAGDSGGGRR